MAVSLAISLLKLSIKEYEMPHHGNNTKNYTIKESEIKEHVNCKLNCHGWFE